MRCISLWQPWAQLVVLGLKVNETRGWCTWHRGPLLIHAAARRPDVPTWPPGTNLAAIYAALERHGYPREQLQLGAVIGGAILEGCTPTESIGELPEFERLAGDFTPGRFAWRLKHPQALREPVPWRGRQRLFDVPAAWGADNVLRVGP